MFLEIGLVFMVILFVASCYVIWNLNTKLESLEDWIEDFINTIQKVESQLKQIDYRGSFEADDETGTIFEQIKTTVSQLDRFKGEEQ
jgi:predicted PurR-regulated permease PerM|tara:strand:+ start:1156 stop:1416 length:261 start_codon:yes stop_codon:yes gene_type:complete